MTSCQSYEKLFLHLRILAFKISLKTLCFCHQRPEKPLWRPCMCFLSGRASTHNDEASLPPQPSSALLSALRNCCTRNWALCLNCTSDINTAPLAWKNYRVHLPPSAFASAKHSWKWKLFTEKAAAKAACRQTSDVTKPLHIAYVCHQLPATARSVWGGRHSTTVQNAHQKLFFWYILD